MMVSGVMGWWSRGSWDGGLGGHGMMVSGVIG